jgi:hypothetical protein
MPELRLKKFNLIKIVRAVFDKIIILCPEASLKGHYFLSWNAQIHWALANSGYLLNTEYE